METVLEARVWVNFVFLIGSEPWHKTSEGRAESNSSDKDDTQLQVSSSHSTPAASGHTHTDQWSAQGRPIGLDEGKRRNGIATTRTFYSKINILSDCNNVIKNWKGGAPGWHSC